jgi:hypothetical protein
VTDHAGRPVAEIRPTDARTKRDSVAIRDGEAVLALRLDRRGNTSVSDPGGRALGRLHGSNRLLVFRLVLQWDGRSIGSVEQRWSQTSDADIATVDGVTAARIRRDTAWRRAGARTSWLVFTDAAHLLPPALLFAAPPALDAMRKQWDRNRHT